LVKVNFQQNTQEKIHPNKHTRNHFTAIFHFYPIVLLHSIICYRRHIVVCLSDCLSVCYAVHCAPQDRCTGLKVVPSCSLASNFLFPIHLFRPKQELFAC